jgi:hypothetical protein
VRQEAESGLERSECAFFFVKVCRRETSVSNLSSFGGFARGGVEYRHKVDGRKQWYLYSFSGLSYAQTLPALKAVFDLREKKEEIINRSAGDFDECPR